MLHEGPSALPDTAVFPRAALPFATDDTQISQASQSAEARCCRQLKRECGFALLPCHLVRVTFRVDPATSGETSVPSHPCNGCEAKQKSSQCTHCTDYMLRFTYVVLRKGKMNDAENKERESPRCQSKTVAWLSDAKKLSYMWSFGAGSRLRCGAIECDLESVATGTNQANKCQ